ncbi:MAG TPA: hypothetical protein VGR22_09740 [Thermomicrobiales bacterium]|nr:hypothetical protein [Thermomicrobiales bacterium]
MSENAAEKLPAEQPDEQLAARADPGRSGASMARVGVWTFAALALLVYLAVGRVDAVWYRYNIATQRMSRQVDERNIVNVWMSWLDNLPESPDDWVLNALFVGSLVVVVVVMMLGAWLLLVSSGDLNPRASRSRR